MKKAITLTEIIIVLIIISLIVAIALPSFSKLQESSLDKEPLSNLKRIQDAEKFYNMEAGGGNNYYPDAATGSVSGTSDANIKLINDNLKLSLSSNSATRNWTYTVYSNGCGQAARFGGDGRSWYLRITDDGTDRSDVLYDGEPDDGTNYTCP